MKNLNFNDKNNKNSNDKNGKERTPPVILVCVQSRRITERISKWKRANAAHHLSLRTISSNYRTYFKAEKSECRPSSRLSALIN
jgi:hypothetical protein